MENTAAGSTVDRRARPQRALASLIVIGAILASGCSDADTTSTWCDSYEAGAKAIISLYETDPAGSNYEEALGVAESAAEVLNSTEVPEEIREDWSAATLGLNPDVVGRQSPSEIEDASDRVSAWVESNCDIDQELLGQLQSPLDEDE